MQSLDKPNTAKQELIETLSILSTYLVKISYNKMKDPEFKRYPTFLLDILYNHGLFGSDRYRPIKYYPPQIYSYKYNNILITLYITQRVIDTYIYSVGLKKLICRLVMEQHSFPQMYNEYDNDVNLISHCDTIKELVFKKNELKTREKIADKLIEFNTITKLNGHSSVINTIFKIYNTSMNKVRYFCYRDRY